MEFITWDRIIVAVVALYGAVVSTINLISKHKEKQRQLKVELSNGFPLFGQTLGGLMLMIEVSNPGFRDVAINVPYLILPDKKTMAFPNPQSDVHFPHKLEEGTKCTICSDMKNLSLTLKGQGYKGIVKIEAGVHDETGKIYKSRKSWKLNIDEWLSR